MSRDLNMWQGIGRLGQDPETRQLPNGDTVANFSIACGDDYMDKNSGELVEQTEWVRVSVFGKTAENVERFCSKGKQVYVQGKLKTRKWQDKDGNDRYTTEINAHTVQFLGGKSDGGERGESEPRQQSRPAPRKEEPFEDDIPF